MWSLFMWLMVRFLVAGLMPGAAAALAAAAAGDGDGDGAGWVAGVADRERAWAAAEERVVTILAVGERDEGFDAKKWILSRSGTKSDSLILLRDPVQGEWWMQLDEGRDLESDGVVMITMAVVMVMVLTGELHGWPELPTGVVGWCSVKSAATPVSCLVRCLLHVGMQLGELGKCGGFPGVAHQFGSTVHQQRVSAEPLHAFCAFYAFNTHENCRSNPGRITTRAPMDMLVVRYECSIIQLAPPAHDHGSFLCISSP